MAPAGVHDTVQAYEKPEVFANGRAAARIESNGTRVCLSPVMRGLDPRIHDEAQQAEQYRRYWWRSLMDCRVKPGNDE
jgi:hypothetical protein